MVRKQAQRQNVFASIEETRCYHLGSWKATVKIKVDAMHRSVTLFIWSEHYSYNIVPCLLGMSEKFYQATSCSFVKQLLAKPRIYYWPNQIKSHLWNFLLLVHFQYLIERVKFSIHMKVLLHSTVFQLFTHSIVIHFLLLILLLHSLSCIST